jgi:hypothetical protein
MGYFAKHKVYVDAYAVTFFSGNLTFNHTDLYGASSTESISISTIPATSSATFFFFSPLNGGDSYSVTCLKSPSIDCTGNLSANRSGTVSNPGDIRITGNIP